MLQRLIAVVLLLVPLSAQAVTLRYAIVIGNNKSGHSELPNLLHAEREAEALYQALLGYGNFEPQRVMLLQSPTRAEVLQAAEKLAALRRSEHKRAPNAEILFALFFSGHGERGTLLLADSELIGDDLADIFKSLQAKVSIGFFDACYSGSLNLAKLKAKGIQPAPSLSVVYDLPRDILSSEGSIWLASSGPNEVSFEDKQLGGVFSHFFVEGMRHAPKDGPGITFERLWEYAQQRTAAYTARNGRLQTPQKYVAQLHTTRPLFFSFPIERSAHLRMEPGISGDFLLTYVDGQLTEWISKQSKETLNVAVYPGHAQVLQLRNGQVVLQKDVMFAKSGTIILHRGALRFAQLGHGTRRLWSKGDSEVVATAITEKPNVLLGAGYQFRYADSDLLAPAHVTALSLRADFARWFLGVGFGYAPGSARYQTLHYDANFLVQNLRLGYAFDAHTTRFGMAALLSNSYAWQEFAHAPQRFSTTWQPGIELSALLFSNLDWLLELNVQGGALNAPSVAANSDRFWRPWFGVGISGWGKL
jgi:hypothetical protein